MLEPILLNLEVGRYVVPILQRPLSYLLAGRRPGGNSGGNISGNSIRGGDKIRGSSGDGGKGGGGCAANTVAKDGTSGGGVRLQVSYNSHLPTLYIQDKENSWNLMVGRVLPNLQVHVL